MATLAPWGRGTCTAGRRPTHAAVLIAGDPEYYPAGTDPAAGGLPTYVTLDGVSSQLTSSADLVAPHILRALCNVRVDRVVTSCVADHAVFLATNGDTYVYGRNDSGQCGVAPARALSAPVRLDAQRDFEPPLAERIVGAATGAAHTLLVTARGELYVAGSNALGQCGMAAERRVAPFRRLQHGPFVEVDDGVAMVSCGEAFSLVLTRSGKGMWRMGGAAHHAVYTMGSTEYGQLGTGELGRQFTSPEDVRYTVHASPVQVSALEQIVQVSCGAHHAMAYVDFIDGIR